MRTIVSRPLLLHPSGEGPEHADNDRAAASRELKLMMICCEENAPYGPVKTTATMFLELLCAAYERHRAVKKDGTTDLRGIRITVYHAQQMDYPETEHEWDMYDGIIIPGSLSAAYDDQVEWIRFLHDVIQIEIHECRRKTLGVCFGHQCYAHSFRERCVMNSNVVVGDGTGGLATLCSIGPIAGRKAFGLTDEGRFLLEATNPISSLTMENEDERLSLSSSTTKKRECLEMLYTRGDMVKSIPSVGVSLLCDVNGKLPNEACAYFENEHDATRFRELAHRISTGGGEPSTASTPPRPYAITFQAHPEYMSDTGFRCNFVDTVKAMEQRGIITNETLRMACEDAVQNYDILLEDCLDSIVSTAVILGWFK